MILNNIKGIFLKVTEYSLYAFFIIFPFFNYSLYLYSSTSTRSINLVGLISLLAIALGFFLFNSKNKIALPKSPILLVLGLYFVSLMISGIYGFNFHTSFWSNVTRMTGIWYLINLGVFILFLSGVMQEKKTQDRLILTITLSTALYSVMYLMSHEGLNWIFPTIVDYAFTFGNTSFAAMYLFGAFILSIYYLFSREVKKWWMYLVPVLLVLNPAFISKNVFLGHISGGFSSIVGDAKASSIVVALSIVIFVCMWGISKIKDAKVRKNIIIGLFALGIFGIGGIVYSLLTPGGYVQEFYMGQSTSARPLIWEMSGKIIAGSPITGWGGDNFERLFEKYYDSRLLQDDYGNEAWFDRAHNIFIDGTIDGGYLGITIYTLIYLVLGLSLLYVVLKSRVRNDILLASLLIVYFALHLLELQTAFDTSVSYIIVAVMVALSINVFHRTLKAEKKDEAVIEINEYAQYAIGLAAIIFFGYTFVVGLIPFIRTQNANAYMRTVGDSQARLKEYDTLFASQIDPSAFLYRTSADLQRGIMQNSNVLNSEAKVKSIDKEFSYLADKYKEYIKNNPDDYRARLNLADILIYVSLFNDNRLEEAQGVLDDAIKLVPQSPLAYWMKAVAYIYEHKFDLAREWAAKGVEVNPKITESHNVVKYVDDSIKTFPDIDLYFFKQT